MSTFAVISHVTVTLEYLNIILQYWKSMKAINEGTKFYII